MSRYPHQWQIPKKILWPRPPVEISFSRLSEIELCPHRWALEHADYPEIWNKHGYPIKINSPELIGIINHSAVQRIIRELVKVGCCSIQDEIAVDVMRSLGGYTTIIKSCIEQILESLKDNPRASNILDSIQSSLLTNADDIRSKVQLLLIRTPFTKTNILTVNRNVESHLEVNKRKELSSGIYSEVDMYSPALGWRGRADLLILTDSVCELVDFKTGAENKQHEFQMLVYALLWYKDKVLNPDSRPVSRLTLSYLEGNIQIPAPSTESLAKLESEILERTNNCIQMVSLPPPLSKPEVGICPFCNVRHLCEDYWKLLKTTNLITEFSKKGFADVEITLVQQLTKLNWEVTLDSGTFFKSNFPIILRIPSNHFSAGSANLGDKLRILNVRISLDSVEPASATLNINNMSEVYQVYPKD